MSSIIEGYNYDIFISYRQKDNKHDGWVTEFVDNLKGELESTFKEEISVYFDINPTDGLLETHDVDASLKDKLKCLIFIPIISRTYCDPKSYAWEHEFKAFIEQASQDQFGLKVKLSGGNVESRVLPVRIYDLDTEDLKQCEFVLGGVLRSVDFIYKSAGVNRPLRATEDHPQDNFNKIYYRDQINKVANSVKEIITAIEKYEQKPKEISKEIPKQPSVVHRNNKTKVIVGSFMVLMLILLGFYFIPKLFKSEEQIEKSIAVLPFINDSSDTTYVYFINGIMDEILNNLQTIKELRVLGRTSVEQFRNNTTKTIPEIARELGVNYIVEGSGQKYGNTFRLRVQLIRAKGKEAHVWAKSYEQEILDSRDIFRIQSEIAQLISSELKATITPVEKQIIEKIPTNNIAALNLKMQGVELVKVARPNNNKELFDKAEQYFRKAIQLDSTYSDAYVHLGWRIVGRNLDSALFLANRAVHFDEKNPVALQFKAIMCTWKGLYKEAEDAVQLLFKYNPNSSDGYHALADISFRKGEYLAAIESELKAAQLCNDQYNRSVAIRRLCDYLLFMGFYEEELKYAEELIKYDNDSLYYYFFLLERDMSQGNYPSALGIALKLYESNRITSMSLVYYYIKAQDFNGALKHVEEYIEEQEQQGKKVNPDRRIGYIYMKNGQEEESVYHFEGVIKNTLKKIEQDQPNPSGSDYFWLAVTYSAMDDNVRAIESLREAQKCEDIERRSPEIIRYRDYSLLDGIRGEPEFQEFIRRAEDTYISERKKIEKLLREKGVYQ